MKDCNFSAIKWLDEHIQVFNNLKENFKEIDQLSKILIDTLFQGNKILIMGNGGSAADSQHFAAELIGRFKLNRPAYAAIALSTDSSILTCVANDFSFDEIFSRQVEALAEQGDLIIGLSTSGKSKNVYKALKAAKEKGCFTASLLGKDGGDIKDVSDFPIIVPSFNTPRIQEAHIFIIHCICEIAEKGLSYGSA